MNKICGIYLIKNKINNKIYVGQSNDINERLSDYSRCNKDSCHKNRPIIAAIRMYGWENFETSILEAVGIEELNEREEYWIKTLKSTYENENYNLAEGGSDTYKKLYSGDKNPFYGHPHTQETKDVLYKKAKERFKNKENNPFYNKKHKPETIEKLKNRNTDKWKKAVLQIDINTNEIIKEWKSPVDAAIELFGNKKKSNGITVACLDYSKRFPTSRKTAFGYKWRYKEDYFKTESENQ